MYRDQVTVPRCQKFIGDVVSTCGRCVTEFACLRVRQCFIQVSENRRRTGGLGDLLTPVRGTGGLSDLVTPEWLGTMRRAAGETKVTNVRVYWRGPQGRFASSRRLPVCETRCIRRGGKDDPRDAELLLDLLMKHRDKLRRLAPDSEATRRVQNLVEERRNLVGEKTAQTNRLTNHLKIYFPQMLGWFDRLDTELVCAPPKSGPWHRGSGPKD